MEQAITPSPEFEAIEDAHSTGAMPDPLYDKLTAAFAAERAGLVTGLVDISDIDIVKQEPASVPDIDELSQSLTAALANITEGSLPANIAPAEEATLTYAEAEPPTLLEDTTPEPTELLTPEPASTIPSVGLPETVVVVPLQPEEKVAEGAVLEVPSTAKPEQAEPASKTVVEGRRKRPLTADEQRMLEVLDAAGNKELNREELAAALGFEGEEARKKVHALVMGLMAKGPSFGFTITKPERSTVRLIRPEADTTVVAPAPTPKPLSNHLPPDFPFVLNPSELDLTLVGNEGNRVADVYTSPYDGTTYTGRPAQYLNVMNGSREDFPFRRDRVAELVFRKEVAKPMASLLVMLRPDLLRDFEKHGITVKKWSSPHKAGSIDWLVIKKPETISPDAQPKLDVPETREAIAFVLDPETIGVINRILKDVSPEDIQRLGLPIRPEHREELQFGIEEAKILSPEDLKDRERSLQMLADELVDPEKRSKIIALNSEEDALKEERQMALALLIPQSGQASRSELFVPQPVIVST